MNKHNRLTLLTLATALWVAATASAAPRSPVTELIVDCQTRALPAQAAVGSMLGIDNLSAAYAARSRLMVDVARACQGRSVSQVRVTVAPATGAKSDNRVASTSGAAQR